MEKMIFLIIIILLCGCSIQEEELEFQTRNLEFSIYENQTTSLHSDNLIVIKVTSKSNETLYVKHYQERLNIFQQTKGGLEFNSDVSWFDLEVIYSKLYSVGSDKEVLIYIPTPIELAEGDYNVSFELGFLVEGRIETLVVENIKVSVEGS